MSDVLKKIRDFMEKKGIPGRDAYELPTSTKTFPDGAKVIESMGANSMNPISDVSLPILGAIRRAVDLTLDVCIIIIRCSMFIS